MTQNGSNDSKVEPTLRRLVVMFDGTGNTRQNMTNVSRMFEAIDDSHPQSYKPIDGSVAEDCPIVQCERCNKSMMERAKHDGDDREANFRAGVPCGSCHQVVVKPALLPVKPVQMVKYIKGVGTTPWGGVLRKLSGLGLGYGLSKNIKEGYIWLCNHYQTGDEVFVFGFSRGAFAARSLVSLLHKCDGVLKKIPNPSTNVDLSFDVDESTADYKAIETAYDYYRVFVKSPNEAKLKGAKPEEAKLNDEVKVEDEAKLNDEVKVEEEAKLNDEAKLKKKAKPEKPLTYLEEQKKIFDDYLEISNKSTMDKYTITQLHVPVKMLGVWDTVGALGIPEFGISFLDNRSWSRAQFKFHDEGLSCIVQNAYHALALDEYREAFKPTLWTSQHPKNQEVKQVWFVGSHCNVGGGADLDDNDDPDDLWQYSYVWMQRHAEKHGLRFYWSFEYPATRQANSHSRTRRVSLRKPEPSLENFVYGLYNKYKKLTPWWSITPYIREADPKLAMLHWSVIERIKVTEDDRKKAEENDPGKKAYRPPSLFIRERAYDEFKASVIPERAIAPDQVDAKGTSWKWHIETDDVWSCPEWGLPVAVPQIEEGTEAVTWWQKFKGYLNYLPSRTSKPGPNSHKYGKI